MKHVLLFFLLMGLQLTSKIYSQIQFPESDSLKGYTNSSVHARVAFPINGKSRIWIKGSDEQPIVKLINRKTQTQLNVITLEPPFFTDVVFVDAEAVDVMFCDTQGSCETYATVYPRQSHSQSKENFSIMLYGCVEPFHIKFDEDGQPKTEIFEGTLNAPLKMRRLFGKVATHQPLAYADSIKNQWEYSFDKKSESTLLNNKPQLIITTGDQVYVDAGYGVKMGSGITHPLSAWETKRRPKPFDSSLVNYEKFLNTLYNASYSFDDIELAHQRLPMLATIDDHELRDGWGSQGDEYEKGKMNPFFKGHYNLGKQAFIENQLLLSNYEPEKARALLKNNQTMNYAFEMNGINGYTFDLRSARNIKENQLLGEKQWLQFEKWLDALEPNQEIILVTSVPLTLRPLKWIEDVYKLFKPELRDDVRDGWSARNNQKERNRLIELLTKHRIVKGIKPIFLSGDIHKSAMIEIWVDPYVGRNSRHDMKETMILGYEVVASGLSHEFLKTGISKSIFKLLESQRLGDGFIDFKYNNKRASIYPMVWQSMVAQNFASVEFSKDQNTKLHTFVFNPSSEAIEQYTIEMDFDKTLPSTDYFEIEKKNGKEKVTFKAPIPDIKRVIINVD